MEKEEFTEICNNVEKDLDTFYKVIYSEGEINSNKDPYYKMVLLHKIIKRLIINYCKDDLELEIDNIRCGIKDEYDVVYSESEIRILVIRIRYYDNKEVVYEHKISYQHECNLNDYLNCEINDYH